MCKKVILKIIEVVIKILEIIKLWIDYCTNEPPLYEPSKWNDDYSIRFNNNCYNYACNIITNTFAQPGRASRIYGWDGLVCQEIMNSAISDGLEQYTNQVIAEITSSREGYSSKECGSCGHLVALCIDPEWPDYHWYRRDRWGLWSHKPGAGKATFLDYSCAFILDPRTADRRSGGGALNYTQFCGFFCVYGKKVEIN